LLIGMMERMGPMFPPMEVPNPRKRGRTKTATGKDSFPEDEGAEIFQFAVAEIRMISEWVISTPVIRL
jgi:hypothetical protein